MVLTKGGLVCRFRIWDCLDLGFGIAWIYDLAITIEHQPTYRITIIRCLTGLSYRIVLPDIVLPDLETHPPSGKRRVFEVWVLSRLSFKGYGLTRVTPNGQSAKRGRVLVSTRSFTEVSRAHTAGCTIP